MPRSTAAAALLLLCLAPAAQAHDTWLALRSSAEPGQVQLALGTGNRFPVMEFPLGIEQLRLSGCRAGEAKPMPLTHDGSETRALRLRMAQTPAGSALSCWAQTHAFEARLTARLVTAYLKEIQAPQRVHQTWAEQQRRGQRWTERYTKFARIELPDADGNYNDAAPSGMAMDLLLLGGQRPLRAGDTAEFRLLRDGQPLADQALELHGEHGALGFWRRTGADGQVRFTLPLAGRWVLRGTELQSPDSAQAPWESRFVTLTFEVGAAPAKTAATRD